MMERRREPRISVSLPLQAAALSGSGTGTAVNMSLCGLLFTVDFPLQAKELVLMRIELDAHTAVDCLAQLVRVDEQDGQWLCAADFRYVSAADRQRMSFMLLVMQDPAFETRVHDAA